LFHLLGRYTAYGGLKLMLRDYLSVPCSSVKLLFLDSLGQIGSPETSVSNHIRRAITQKTKIKFNRGGSMRSRILN
jgi:hypothetical protein